MKTTIVGLFGIVGIMMCSGCASIVSHSQWPVTITSNPSGASLTIKNKKGDEIQKGITPMTITLRSGSGYFSSAEYQCAFEKEGYFPASTSLSAGFNGWYVGNIVFGGLIGLLIVDPATGAMWRLDDKVVCTLSPDPNAAAKGGKPQPNPDAEQVKTTVTPSTVSESMATRSAQPKIWGPDKHHQLWLLVVGVGQYKNPQVPALPYAKQDAERIRDWALQLNSEQLTRDNISVLTDEQATRENLLNQIDWLRKQALPEDAAFIYFAGHGAPELAADGKEVDAKYLLLYNTNPDELFATGLSLDDLTRKLDTVKAKTQVVILEACYTGPVGQEVLKKTPTADLEIRPRFMQEMGERGGRVILSASSGRQVAIGSEDIKGGLFTHYLLAAWGDGSKRLLTDGFDDAREQVRRAANQLGSTQEPARFGDQNVDVILKP